jgi:hypothetical protein
MIKSILYLPSGIVEKVFKSEDMVQEVLMAQAWTLEVRENYPIGPEQVVTFRAKCETDLPSQHKLKMQLYCGISIPASNQTLH